MKVPFGFFLRLFLSFLAAKLILRALDCETLGWLIFLTLIFLINAYLFEFPTIWERLRGRRQGAPTPSGQGHKTPPPPPSQKN